VLLRPRRIQKRAVFCRTTKYRAIIFHYREEGFDFVCRGRWSRSQGERGTERLGEDVLTTLVNWLVRGLMAIVGIALVVQGLPVARGALLGQKADAVVAQLRDGRPMTMRDIQAGIASLSEAVAANPTAGRYLLRSELEGGAPLTPALKANREQTYAWVQAARADLELGLANDPARSIDWARLAVMREAYDGPSRKIIELLDMSIRTGPWLSTIWPTRLRLILDTWPYYTEQEKPLVQSYVVEMYRRSKDARMFGQVVRDPIDEVILRSLLRDVPGAQETLTTWIRRYQAK
jgi:hypothetical protein